jgi:hypothetical protein
VLIYRQNILEIFFYIQKQKNDAMKKLRFNRQISKMGDRKIITFPTRILSELEHFQATDNDDTEYEITISRIKKIAASNSPTSGSKV